jgi:hypothetical protein
MVRFLPDVARTRRAVGWVLLVVFSLPILGLIKLTAEPGQWHGSAFFLFGGCALVLALGARLAFRPSEFFEIDLESRKFEVFRKGKRSAAGTLDDLGPLEVRQRTRVVGTGKDRRTVTDYVVRGAAHSDIDLYSVQSAGRARQKMEALARAWRLPCQSLGGAVRQPEALDTPLHERLRGDSAARKPMPLSPGWGLRIDPAPMGYAMVSTHRSWAPLRMAAGFLVMGLVILGGSISYGVWTETGKGDPFAMVMAGLVSVLVLSTLGLAMKGVRDTFFPGVVHINEQGVSYRGSRMRFKQIEEVTATAPIELIGDGRILKLARTFCPMAATPAVVHELQRLIVEVASSHESGA